MAFSMGAANPPAELGPELPDPICGATKGIVVGAGPNTLCVASTESVRAAISADDEKEKVKTKPFQPQATISLPGRPTHIAFASGDSALVLATESGTHLSVFETGSLLQPNAQPAISIPTNGATFRTVAPNPAQAEDSHSSLVALVTNAGELLMADLKAGNLVTGANGNILKADVSSVGWSNKGKQLVAGLVDGTGYVMTPDGVQKDLIPKPPDLTDPCHVSSIAWLENDIFLMVYTPNVAEDDAGLTPSSSYYIITRRKQQPFLIQKLPELASPFGYKRAPAYQFIARIRNYMPHLTDALIVSSTASADIGLITRSSQALASDDSARAIVGQFATTEVNDDSKKASVPLKDSTDETSVIGLGLDFSSSEPVIAPIQGEDIAESSTPLPNLLLLNHEGVLCSWWFVYNESIRQKVPYDGLTSAKTQVPPALQSQSTQPQPAAQSPFAQPSFGSPAAPSSFGTTGFGKPSAAPAFGSPSVPGTPQQPSFGKPSFGTPAFGTSAFGAPAFGAPAALGSNAPKFGQSGFGQSSTPVKSLFGASGAPAGGGFGSFANVSGGGGFASLATSKPSEGSPFGKLPSENPFGKSSVFGAQSETTAFTPQKTEESKGAFGAGSSGFVLGSTFKGDGTAVNDAPKPEKPSGLFSFGSSFDEMVSTPSKTSPPTEAMDDIEDSNATSQNLPAAKEPAPSLFGASSKPSTGSSIFGSFGSQTQNQSPFGSAQTSKSPFSLLGNKKADNQAPSPSSAPSEKTAVASPPFTKAKSPEPEPPLPPDSTSRAVYGPGDTSASSNVSKSSVDDAPLPPDFTASRKSPEPESEPPLPPDFLTQPKKEEPEEEEEPVKAEEAPLPPDFTKPSAPLGKDSPLVQEESDAGSDLGSDADESQKGPPEDESELEDSGEDNTHEVKEPSVESSPESSLDDKHMGEGSAGGLFGKKQLFGEISKPLFPQTAQSREPPRSPSPIRPPRTRQGLPKTENLRSISAPHKPGDALAARKASLTELAKREELRQPARSRAREPEPQPVETEEEALSDDEDERLRADLNRPLEPVPTLDPFLPHQDYTGETSKPGIPGQIERLYRDINSMVDTLGINARSLSSFLLYQQKSTDSNWINILRSDSPTDILDEKLLLRQIEDLDSTVSVLAESLEKHRVQGVEEKLESCRELLGKDIFTLRSQCASIRKTLDAYTDAASIVSAPLSAEQANLQQDLRTSSVEIQTKLAELESAVSLLRAKIADSPRADGSRPSTRRPTVEAVTSTIATMMNMVESKSGDIDVLEVQMKKLGFDTSAAPPSREGSPFTTPRKGLSRVPATPGSRGTLEDPVSSYHTPDSSSRGINMRSSINGSAKASRLRLVELVNDGGDRREVAQWKAKMQRKQHLMGSLRKAIEEKETKVRSVDDI
ncbi:hypothetical protein AN2086.2 [Aspergillus nidulans FGSC A4]|uniref:Nuclear pore complex protein An-Nup159 (Eurofung) n=1 Tax=Emericella nidulans (strain FGSC A4 / ATCC 38163 / CBS 112.46 / NRRL 194 / M139) TaxID=227321 RepID=Q5BBJ4_EMENI|nr:FG-nucleoporin NUP159 [Aspergillus nidulans FGSC A4]EAA64918.1 hypothetical protein AN2086.2 [Aspergillus nidulans FGSC A4]CBF86150.1 TPA: Nuclear pore complex protein An-Nup159 (Eurofung) [Aspergillus nidulans FGSC A4]|eukprot:XP_659690.1 hypothetical protein AN2086.2 [Aspergillus nidulans FGSC A4]